jgi:hypothetical protein
VVDLFLAFFESGESMDADTQAKWDQWCDARIENRAVRLRDALGDALGETMQKFDAKIAKVRQEMRDSPPLFSAPDKALSGAMARVGAELSAQKEGIDALRGAVGECAKRSDLGGVRQRLERRIAELEECNEVNAKNVLSLHTMVFNLRDTIERLHALVVRFAAAADCGDALTPLDKHIGGLAAEQKNSAVVLRLQDLRRSA